MQKYSFLRGFVSSSREFLSKSGQSAIARRLLISVLMISSIFACLQTGFQIKIDYQSGIDSINREFDQIERSYTQSLSQSIWEVDTEQVKNIASGIFALPNMAEVRVMEHTGGDSDKSCQSGQYTELISFSNSHPKNSLSRTFAITTNESSKTSCIGRLDLNVSLETLYRDLTEKFLLILIFQAIKTFSVSILILATFHHLVTRHLMAMANFSKSTNEDNLEQKLELDFGGIKTENELTHLADTLNLARGNVKKILGYQKGKIDLEHELEKQLEKEKLKEFHNRLIEKKNTELATTNTELTHTVNMLESAQGQLVRAERMAALGSMVRGVAHELNTPIGVAATGSTLIQSKVLNLSERYHSGSMTQDDLEGGLKTTSDSANLVVVALHKASNLIQTFKQISVEENEDQQTEFNLSDHINNILMPFRRELDTRNITMVLNLPTSLVINSFPSAFYQIMVNLLKNSLDHAFHDAESGTISIESHLGNDTLELIYHDNGAGIEHHVLPHVFDPFFSTSESTDNSGLGLNIAYNLATDRLNGSLNVTSVAHEKTTFTLTIKNIASQ